MNTIIFYCITFGISILNLWIYMSLRSKQKNTYYPLMFLFMAVSNGGYLALSASQTIEAATLANKLCYVGGTFLMPLVFLCVLDLCNMQLPMSVRMLLNGISIGIYLVILTIGYLPLYYTTLYISGSYGYTHIERTPGPLYFLSSLQMVVYVLLIIGTIIYSFRRKRTVSYKNLIFILGMVLATLLLYSSKKILGYNFNLIPLAYAINGIILLALQRRLSLYDVSSSVALSLYEQDLYGYITFDRRKAFLANDHMAADFFPELQTLHVDHTLPKDNELFKRFHEWMNELDEIKDHVVYYEERNGKEVKCTTSFLRQKNTNKNQIIGYMIELFDVTDERKYLNLLAKYNEELKNNVENETKHVKEVQDKMILGMANMIENRDNSTGGHVKRTSKCIEIIANELKNEDQKGIFTDQFCRALVKAAPMHDIGKISVDDDILRKPGKFTPEEFEQMKKHAANGADLLNTIIENVEDEYFTNIAENMAHFHHERWNGTGYPHQLSGETIPLEARIMAIADVYDALVSKRCYKDKMSFEEAANIIREGMGTQFDPALAEIFEKCRPKLEEYYRSNNEG